MKSHFPWLRLFALLILTAAVASAQQPSAFGPSYFGPTYNGFGGYGNGVHGPGYYGTGPLGSPLYQPSPLYIDPSLRFHTYPSFNNPSPSGAPLAPALGDSALGGPLSPRYFSRSLPIESPATWPSRGKIEIRHAANAKEDLTYALNGSTYTIRPGYLQKFDEDRLWILSLGEKTTLPKSRYTLAAGTFQFGKGEKGWELHAVSSDPSR